MTAGGWGPRLARGRGGGREEWAAGWRRGRGGPTLVEGPAPALAVEQAQLAVRARARREREVGRVAGLGRAAAAEIVHERLVAARPTSPAKTMRWSSMNQGSTAEAPALIAASDGLAAGAVEDHQAGDVALRNGRHQAAAVGRGAGRAEKDAGRGRGEGAHAAGAGWGVQIEHGQLVAVAVGAREEEGAAVLGHRAARPAEVVIDHREPVGADVVANQADALERGAAIDDGEIDRAAVAGEARGRSR